MDLIRTAVMWALAGGAILACSGLLGWVIYAIVKDVREWFLIKDSPRQTITTWYVYIVFSNSLKYMYRESDDEVADAGTKARELYDSLVARKRSDDPLLQTIETDGKATYDLRLVEKIKIESGSHTVAVLPNGKRRTVYS